MTTDQTNTSGAKQYRMDPASIDKSYRAVVADKLGKDADLYPAKDGGSYKGRIIHEDDRFMVQAIGKRESSAVIHEKSGVEVKGASLASRASNNDLTDRNVQIHYRDRSQSAAMYAWNPAKEAEQRADRSQQKAAGATERLLEDAKAYAAENIKTPKARETFMQHFGAVMEQANQRRELARGQEPQQQQQKPKQQEAER